MCDLCNPGWISKRLRLPPIIEAHSQALPRHPGTTPPGNCIWQSLSSLTLGERYVTVRGGGLRFMVKKHYHVTLEWPFSLQATVRTGVMFPNGIICQYVNRREVQLVQW